MARTLRGLGFTVLLHENVGKRAMEDAVLEFGRRIAEGGVGLFFYAGLGMQVRGRNYLVPVDACIQDEAATRVAAVDVDLLLEQLSAARNRVKVVILDACRNNPFEQELRGGCGRAEHRLGPGRHPGNARDTGGPAQPLRRPVRHHRRLRRCARGRPGLHLEPGGRGA